MMGVPPSDARRLTIWEFTAMRTVWNARHRSGDEPVTPPSADFVRERQSELYDLGIATPAGSA